MRFDVASARLANLPEPLPPPLDVLMPVVMDGVERRLSASPPLDVLPGRPAAVLVLVFPDEVGEASIVLIERPTADGHHHSGEVSFPGGKAEPDDADAVATALREATEEVGLDPAATGLRVVGLLERQWIPVSDFAVTPVVAVATRRPVLVPSPDEVAAIVLPPVARFLPDAPVEIIDRVVRGWPLRYGHFDLDGLSVWGMTARVLSQLGAILASGDGP